MQTETIAAIATAAGTAGVGIVRISGEQAAEVAGRVFSSPSGKEPGRYKTHTVHYGYVHDDGQPVDEALLILMRAPHSFTAEDTVEIQCHGGSFLVRRVLETVLKHGARLAEPGEFTKRAFLNGRIDLSQAEAVMSLIQSQNEYAWKASLNQLKGRVSEEIGELRAEILYQAAFLESALDDPEHISLEGYNEKLYPLLQKLEERLCRLIASFDNGRLMREGIKTVIIGKPNAGKSSLLNLLAGEERAIVTEVAGTTRDILEETVLLDGIPLRILDTAGIRHTEDLVESIGIERALHHVKDADMILYVADALAGFDENDEQIWRHICEKQVIVLINKSDLLDQEQADERLSALAAQLPKERRDEPPILFSAKDGDGLEALADELKKRFFFGGLSWDESVVITNVRHKNLLKEALESLRLVEKSIEDQMPEDFYSIDLMDAYKRLGLILGEEIEDDLVDEIFRRFCMGK